MRIVILDGYTENPGNLSWDGFKELVEITVYDRTEPAQIVERIGATEVIIFIQLNLAWNRPALRLCDGSALN